MSWLQATIGDVCLPTGQRDPSRNGGGTFRYVDIAGIDRELKKIARAEAIPCSDAPSRARKEIKAGDVIISTVRPNLNAIAQIPEDLDGEIASTGFAVLRANPKLVDSRYLFYRAQHQGFVDYLVANATGASYPAVSDSIVRRAELPLPPPKEQSRIIEILDEADRLRKLRRDADAKAARILPVLFLNMFGDPATNPKAWPSRKLGLIADTSSGGTPDTKKDEYYGGHIPWVKSGELACRTISKTEETISESGLLNSSAKWVEPGTILVAMYGATVGQVAKLAIRATTNQAVCAIKARDEVQSGYLIELLRLSKPIFLARRVGGAQPNISQQIVRDLEVPIPPCDLQVTFSNMAFEVENAIEVASRASEQLESLFRTLMQRAFSGQLTNKWREAHMKELLAEMEAQARILNLPMRNSLEVDQ